ncbi:MAG: hypothetical protein AAB512_04105 [Patescibacteria group bacterium]
MTPEAQHAFPTVGPEFVERQTVVNFGPATLASQVSGYKLDNATLTDKILRNSRATPGSIEEAELPKSIGKFIDATGMSTRYSSTELTRDPARVLERTAAIGAELVREAMQRQGWDHIDYLFDTSASLSPEVAELMLDQANIDPATVITRPYRVACAGAATAFDDSLLDPEARDKNVVVCALEPLSQHTSDGQLTLKNMGIPTIFGDDYAIIAYNPADFEVVSARTHIVYDGAPIRFHTDYGLPPSDDVIPAHYIFSESGIDISSVSEKGFFIKIEDPESDLPAEMDGIKTATFFIRATAEVIQKVVECAQAKKVDVRQVVMHQPSLKVNEGIQNRVGKYPNLANLNIPDFLLGEIGRSNSSSATTLVIWEHLARTGKLNPRQPFLICAPGIGAVITAAVIVPKQAK